MRRTEGAQLGPGPRGNLTDHPHQPPTTRPVPALLAAALCRRTGRLMPRPFPHTEMRMRSAPPPSQPAAPLGSSRTVTHAHDQPCHSTQLGRMRGPAPSRAPPPAARGACASRPSPRRGSRDGGGGGSQSARGGRPSPRPRPRPASRRGRGGPARPGSAPP